MTGFPEIYRVVERRNFTAVCGVTFVTERTLTTRKVAGTPRMHDGLP
jgi:hypothetical protein